MKKTALSLLLVAFVTTLLVAVGGQSYAQQTKMDTNKTVKELETAVQQEPNNALAHLKLGMAYAEIDDTKRAGAEFDKVLRLDPKMRKDVDTNRRHYWIVKFNEGLRLCSVEKNYAEGAKEFQRAVDLDPADVLAYTNLAFCLGQLGKHQEAVALLEKAAALNPTDEKAKKNLAALYEETAKNDFKDGRYSKAMTLYSKALEMDPKRVGCLLQLGNCYFQEALVETSMVAARLDYERAIEFYKRVGEDDPDDIDAVFNMGMAYLALGNLDESIRLLRDAVDRDPRVCEFHKMLGTAYARTGDNELAVAELVLSKALDPNRGTRMNDLDSGLLPEGMRARYSDIGDLTKAIKDFGKPEEILLYEESDYRVESWFYWTKGAAMYFVNGKMPPKNRVTFSPNSAGGRVLASGSADNTVKLSELTRVEPGPKRPPAKLAPEPKLPPCLAMEVAFFEPSGNRALDAEEKGTVEVTVRNTGKGAAYGVIVGAATTATVSGLSIGGKVQVGDLATSEEKKVRIPLEASDRIQSQDVELRVSASELNGFNAGPVVLEFQTKALVPPDLQLVDHGIEDADRNGRVDLGEQITVTLRVQNLGRGKARGVRVEVVPREKQGVFYPDLKSLDIGALGPGEYRDMNYVFFTNTAFSGNSVGAVVRIVEGRERYSMEYPLEVAIAQRVRELEKVRVEPEVVAGVKGELEPAKGLSSDIDVPPKTKIVNPNAVAVVIGIRRYQRSDVPLVEYALRDAEAVRSYLESTLGYRPENIIFATNETATKATFEMIFQEQLVNYVKPGESDVFIYYSGHGAPDMKTGEAYFVPHDCHPDYATTTGYPVKRMLQELVSLRARSVTVVVDACFSGESEGGTILKEASPLSWVVERPAGVMENGTLFFSSSGSQLSTWYTEKKHGLFTYFFLKGLRGEADADKDGAVAVDELERYVKAEVTRTARFLRNREQEPEVYSADKARVLVRYTQ